MTDKREVFASPPGGLSFSEALGMTADEVSSLLRSAPAVIRPQTSHLAAASGKGIRARALLTCALREGGLIDPAAVKAAAAVEILHLATLVHDDIIDKAKKRRGIAALHTRFGEKAAVLCGDYLFCIALQLAAAVPDVKDRAENYDETLPGYLTAICLGEIRENKNNRNYNMSEREYFKIISGKTAALFEASFHLGFLLSGEPENKKSAYLELGRSVGMIFQLADDCSDYESTRKRSGKPVLSDYKNGIVTLPLIRAMKNDTSLRERVKQGIAARELKAAVKAAGGLEYAHGKIYGYYAGAEKLIAALDLPPEKKDRLEALLQTASGLPAEGTAGSETGRETDELHE